MDIVILVLLSGAIVLLISIFALLLLKNKRKLGGESILSNDAIEEHKKDIVLDLSQKADATKDTMLGEISRSISGVNSNLTSTVSANNELINKTLDSFRDAQDKKFTALEGKIEDRLGKIHNDVRNSLGEQKLDNTKNSNDLKNMIKDKFVEIDKAISKELAEIRKENQDKLDQMRGVVEEKLQDTLDKKITASFDIISKQLQAVSKGLGEMTSLTNGVNNLNKIMSNVKIRGIWGEVSLNALLEQILTSEQYETQLAIKGREMVDFAVLLPGKKDEEKVYLPIDAKFPLADYQNLVEASESCNKDLVDTARKNLFKRIKEEAKSICEKYIDVPKTTNFAIMYLPIEGLFAEVVRDTALLDELQNKFNVVISGPTTITALLNSLQLGFKTLQIQKSSTEVWNALSKFKTEFQKFNEALVRAKKNADTVVSSIEATTKKTKKIESMLGKLDKMDYSQEEKDLLGDEDNGGEDSDN